MKRIKIVKKVGVAVVVLLMSNAWTNAQEAVEVLEEDAVIAEAQIETEDVTEVNIADAEIEAAIEDTAAVVEPVVAVVGDAKLGRAYYDGSKGFLNGGPACVTCHNVTNDELIPGGLLAKDLTDVYERMGEGITAWLGAPPFPAMVASYQNHTLTELERSSLTAFLKEANEVKDTQTVTSGTNLFLYGGATGLLVIMGIISLLWMKRKKNTVKQDIFLRQSKSADAKF